MKRSLYPIFASLAPIFLTAFLLGAPSEPTPPEAVVSKHNGLYVYYLAKPTADYEVLGTLKGGVVIFGFPSEYLNSVTRRAGRKYPKAEGVIFTNNDMRRAKVIRFK